MKMQDTNKYRFCNEGIEDCYHLLIECTQTIHANQIRELRVKLGITSRAVFYKWIYRQTQSSIDERRQFLNGLKDLEVEL